MAVYKRGRTWWFSFIFEGRHIQQSTKQGNIKVARQREAAFKTQLTNGNFGILEKKPAPIFTEAMKSFLAWSRDEHREHPATTRRYAVSSVALLAYFGKERLDRITAQDIERFKQKRINTVSERTGRKIKPASVNRELACLRKLLNYHSIVSPFGKPEGKVHKVQLFKEKNQTRRVLTFIEEEKYLAACSQPLRDVAVLMLETGMRPQEVAHIRRENVHLEHDYLHVPEGKTESAQRDIRLSARAKAVLSMRLAGAKGAYLFPHEKDVNQPMLKVNAAHCGAVRRSGIAPARLYDLRHSFATRAAESGIPLATLAELLGHAGLRLLKRYVHPTDDHKAAAAQRIEAYNQMQRMQALEQLQQTAAVQ